VFFACAKPLMVVIISVALLDLSCSSDVRSWEEHAGASISGHSRL